MAALGLAARRRPAGDLRRPRPARRGRLPRRATASARWRSWARSSSPSPAPRRSTPTWATSAAARSAPPGSALVFPALALNYLGQGSLVLANPAAADEPLLPDGAGLGPPAAGAARHLRHGHRQPGGDHRRLLADPAGGAARPAAAARDPAHLRVAGRPDLHAAGQLDAARRGPRCSSSLFRSSSALASAYGIAVTGTMVVTSLLAFAVFRRAWRWPLAAALAVIAPLLAHRADLPRRQPRQVRSTAATCRCCIAGVVGLLMTTWVRGTAIVQRKARVGSVVARAR